VVLVAALVGDDERDIERMYEMLDSYHQKRSATAPAPARREPRTGHVTYHPLHQRRLTHSYGRPM